VLAAESVGGCGVESARIRWEGRATEASYDKEIATEKLAA
jgi:hypothetical protein